jgi:hypothetical protein
MAGFGHLLGNVGGPLVAAGVRAQPGVAPAPNSQPAGARTGAPPRTKLYSRQVMPFSALGTNSNEATLIISGTPENRVSILTAPLVGFRIYIGDSGVSPQTGLALPPGLAYDVPLVGLQDVYAVTDAPVYLPLQILISIVLMAEQQRPT